MWDSQLSTEAVDGTSERAQLTQGHMSLWVATQNRTWLSRASLKNAMMKTIQIWTYALGNLYFKHPPFFVMDTGYLIKGESKDVRVNLIFLLRVGVLKH